MCCPAARDLLIASANYGTMITHTRAALTVHMLASMVRFVRPNAPVCDSQYSDTAFGGAIIRKEPCMPGWYLSSAAHSPATSASELARQHVQQKPTMV
jgi:hypothetical protein